jgi:hypothetical protein
LQFLFCRIYRSKQLLIGIRHNISMNRDILGYSVPYGADESRVLNRARHSCVHRRVTQSDGARQRYGPWPRRFGLQNRVMSRRPIESALPDRDATERKARHTDTQVPLLDFFVLRSRVGCACLSARSATFLPLSLPPQHLYIPPPPVSCHLPNLVFLPNITASELSRPLSLSLTHTYTHTLAAAAEK